MRLITFEEPYNRTERLGILVSADGESFAIDANRAHARMLKGRKKGSAQKLADSNVPPDMVGLLRSGRKSFDAMREVERFSVRLGSSGLSGPKREKAIFRLSEVKVMAPVPRPGKIIHTAGNFREHAKEGTESGWEFPIPKWISFLKSPSAIIGDEGKIVRPRYTKELDYEIELAIIIGKKSKHLTKEGAWKAIAGFTVFNDITARDIQREEMKSGLLNFGKNMDTFAPFGPCMVPKEDIGDVHKLKIECRVNGEPRQVSNTSHLSVTVPEIVQHYSWVTLYPGDIITTGTVSGVAAFRKDPEKYYLKPGDVLESEIEKIGVLRNYVVEDEEVY
ncbi:MAG: fumarylacetoacetate hydrolase family protein [Thaumarchaeota archaeon]|nr:MAG: fumarylacetoacetate hydrolase family protein [Nitrososphaerota archaeon]